MNSICFKDMSALRMDLKNAIIANLSSLSSDLNLKLDGQIKEAMEEFIYKLLTMRG